MRVHEARSSHFRFPGRNLRTSPQRTFRTLEEAIERANNTPYGLSAGVWTDKGSKIFKIVNKLRAGVVWANTYNKFDPTSPFGGYKESGFGREGGLHGLLPGLNPKLTVTVALGATLFV